MPALTWAFLILPAHFFVDSNSNLSTTLKPYFTDKNTIVFMGAGSITHMAHDFFKTNDK